MATFNINNITFPTEKCLKCKTSLYSANPAQIHAYDCGQCIYCSRTCATRYNVYRTCHVCPKNGLQRGNLMENIKNNNNNTTMTTTNTIPTPIPNNQLPLDKKIVTIDDMMNIHNDNITTMTTLSNQIKNEMVPYVQSQGGLNTQQVEIMVKRYEDSMNETSNILKKQLETMFNLYVQESQENKELRERLIGKVEERFDEKNDENKELKKKLEMLEKRLLENNTRTVNNDDYDRMNGENSALKINNKRLRQENKELRKKLEKFGNRGRELKNEVKVLTQQNHELNIKLTQLSNNNNNIEVTKKRKMVEEPEPVYQHQYNIPPPINRPIVSNPKPSTVMRVTYEKEEEDEFNIPAINDADEDDE